MDAFEAIKATFFQECDELLADLEAKLLVLESGQTDNETINAVFRAVHSVKGGAGAFGLDALVRFAHVFETLLDELRAGRKPCDEITVRTLLRASDVLADHVAAAQGHAPEVDEARSAGLVAEMEVLTHGEASVPGAAAEEEDDFGFTPLAAGLAPLPSLDLPPLDLPPLDAPVAALPPLDAPASAPAAGAGWRIVFRPHGAMYANANETGLLLRELGRLGSVDVTLDDSAVPALDALDVEENHLVWTIELTGDVTEAAIRDVFDFVESDCDLSVTAFGDGADAGAEPAAAPAPADLDISALLAKAAEPVVEAPIPAPAPAPVAPVAA
ncbi:Hpt domain-containing protein, partial [Brevundimonas sp. FT23028]|uniref:Hpt domain-containing protein n=1 Tax=Brevundimonas sp. FT23028 TaxID=3393748 RepID=UPI003B586468